MITPIPWERSEAWVAEVVNPDGTHGPLQLDADQPGTLTWDGNAQTPIRYTGHCLGTPPELMRDQRIQLTLNIDGRDPFQFPRLVPVKDNPVYEWATWFSLGAVDETIIYAADGIDFPLVLDSGAQAVASARNVLTASAPDLPVILPDSDLTLRNQLSFNLGTSPLEISNQLMEVIGGTRLAPSMEGTLTSRIWTPAADRAVTMIFGPDESDAGYQHRIEIQRLHLEAPNVQHYVGNGSQDSAQITGRWRDEDPRSPYSIPSRRRRILGKQASGEAATQAIADQMARRAGLEARGRGRTATITGLWQPLVPGDVIQTRHPLFPELVTRWEVLTVAITVGGDASDTTWTLREVI